VKHWDRDDNSADGQKMQLKQIGAGDDVYDEASCHGRIESPKPSHNKNKKFAH
jgi:hypothetical protein